MKKFLSFLLLATICINYSLTAVVYAQVSDLVIINATVLPSPATNFKSTPGYNPGQGECELTWTTSPTPNIINQRLDMDEYPFSSINSSLDLPFPGPSIGDSIVISGLIVGWTYYFELISEGNTNSSTAASTYCTPAWALPAPVMVAEPATTIGTSNTVSWTNGGIDDAALECRVGASTSNLGSPPFTYFAQSPWALCPDSGTTYSYTFNGLALNTIYSYHVQSRTPADGLSPFSNVVFSTQISSGGGGGGGGTTITPVCGNNIKQYGEQCDDGNITPGDGCSATCQLEPAPVCGNNAIETGETCDDGNTTSGDGCSSTCSTEAPVPGTVCGNNIIEEGETCDDGNTTSGDGCSSTCDTEHAAPEEQICGNNAVEEGEECDDGNNINNDGCNSACMLEPSAACGNGILEEPEQCDDGNIISGDGCSETCALEVVKVKFEIKGAPEFRVLKRDNPNLSLNSQFLVYKPSINNLDNVRVKLDDFGNATYEGLIVTGNYDFGLNGEAHNTKLIKGVEITPETEVVTLDFTYAETVKLTAGDTVDDNYINGVDMSKVIQQYRLEGAEVLSDLNREGYVNGIDASIVITNYRKSGESF